MDILIKDINASKSVIEHNFIRWKLYVKKVLKFFIILYAIGLSLFIIGMVEFSEYGWKHFNGETNLYTNWHFSESLGLVLLLIATYFLIQFFKLKKKFFKKSKATSDRLLKSTNEILIQINDDYVGYKSYELNQEIKWWLFSSYLIHNNYLILNFDENILTNIIIDKRLITSEEFNLVLDVVKKRVVKKE